MVAHGSLYRSPGDLAGIQITNSWLRRSQGSLIAADRYPRPIELGECVNKCRDVAGMYRGIVVSDTFKVEGVVGGTQPSVALTPVVTGKRDDALVGVCTQRLLNKCCHGAMTWLQGGKYVGARSFLVVGCAIR